MNIKTEDRLVEASAWIFLMVLVALYVWWKFSN
jgi:hypothetical protein